MNQSPSVLMNPETDPQAQHEAHDIGSRLVAETVIASVRPLELNGKRCMTDLPVGVEVFEDVTEEMADITTVALATLRPTALDTIPVGKFSVTGELETFDDNFQPITMTLNRPIEAAQTDKGKVVSTESFGKLQDEWKLQPDMGDLMEALGYVTETSDGYRRITAIPTPDTIKRAASKLGVDIKLFPDDGYIPGIDYLQTFADGQYPVSTGKSEFYKHDIEDDHLTSMALGGEPLKSALRTVAAAALQQGEAVIDDTARGIDSLTNALRGVVATSSEFLGSAFGKEASRATFQAKAANIGISAEVANEIIAVAQENGRKYNLHVQQID